ncbi:MAG: hypothetical protein ACLKAK_12210 [Alkaliphilus sp.]
MLLKTIKPEIIENLQEENKLSSKYMKLIAAAKIIFDGEERNLSQMEAYTKSPDREIRKQAQAAQTEFFVNNETKFDEFLERGGFWFRQGHIFQNSFYYIDDTLAQICVFEFWEKSKFIAHIKPVFTAEEAIEQIDNILLYFSAD